MSENEKKEESKEIASISNDDKTSDIINSINSIVIPNVEEVSSISTNDNYYNNNIKKEGLLKNKSESIQKANNLDYNIINSYQNQIISNNNKENIIQNTNSNQNNVNVNNLNNINLNNNINNQINEENFNVNNNIINKENNFNNNMNLFQSQNMNQNMYINQNIKNDNNISQNNLNVNNSYKPHNNFNQNFHPPINKSLNRKKSNAERKSGQKGMKELAFKFPIQESFSKVEIPFSFHQNLDEPNNNSRFHTYITIKDVPKLHIDISDETKMSKFELSSNIESLKTTNLEQKKNAERVDAKIVNFEKDNEELRKEIENIKNEINLKNQEVANLELAIKQINQNNIKFEEEMKQKINEKNNSYTQLKEQFDSIKNETINKNLDEKQQKEYLTKIHEEINKIQKEYQNNYKYYTNKLMNNNNYKMEYIEKCLQKDLLDFTSYVTQKIQIISPKVKELINYIQNAVDASIGKDYEVKLYGSHATGLCLPWSDIDVVLCKKNGEVMENNNYLPLHELFTYLQKKNDLFKSINYIGTTTVPLIKIKTKENIGIQSVDISLQDKGHYGIKCVSLVLSFKEEYEVLLPMILALKNILKQANLNDPYKVRKLLLYNFKYYYIIGWVKFLWLSPFSCAFFKITKRAK